MATNGYWNDKTENHISHEDWDYGTFICGDSPCDISGVAASIKNLKEASTEARPKHVHQNWVGHLIHLIRRLDPLMFLDILFDWGYGSHLCLSRGRHRPFRCHLHTQLQVIWQEMGVNPKIGVGPPNHPILIGFSIIKHPFWGVYHPYFLETSRWSDHSLVESTKIFGKIWGDSKSDYVFFRFFFHGMVKISWFQTLWTKWMILGGIWKTPYFWVKNPFTVSFPTDFLLIFYRAPWPPALSGKAMIQPMWPRWVL